MLKIAKFTRKGNVLSKYLSELKIQLSKKNLKKMLGGLTYYYYYYSPIFSKK